TTLKWLNSSASVLIPEVPVSGRPKGPKKAPPRRQVFEKFIVQVVLLLCRLRPQYQFSHNRKTPPPLLGMVSLAIALPPPSVHEIRLESDMFITRLNFDFTIAHCEPRVADLLEYTADEITGMNMYTLCHGEDANRLRKSHIDLINKGQVLTHYYRLMNKNGGYTWIQTCATVICNNKNADEQNIICINYVVSGKEYKNLIMDCCQLEEHVKAQRVKREDTSGNDPENGSPGSDTGEGRSSGGGRVQERHLGPSELEEESPDLAGDQRGRGHMDHIHPPDHQQINNVLTRPHKKTGERRASKRKNDDESSYSSDEDVANGGGSGGAGASGGQPVRKRYPILSPASSSCQSSALAGSPKAGNEVDSDSAAGGTVKELEQAMSKHLPPPPQDKTSAVAQQHTDFSTDALLKAQQRSTIQWIGALQQQHAPGPGGGPLPASTLLRQLYANRESVIRANVTTRGGGYYGPDMIGPLPTPPGSEGSGGAYGGPQDYNALYPNYSAAAAAAAAVEYHSAMTPPSSVSPRDKHQPAAGPIMTTGFDSPPVGGPYATHDMLRSSYLDQPLPLKPQPYAHHHLDPSSYAAAAAAAATTAAASLEQSAHQFYAATGANTPAAATAFHHLTTNATKIIRFMYTYKGCIESTRHKILIHQLVGTNTFIN
ncbi:unnamed protein product, partial [Nesidiocoris tenuis]